MLIWSHLLRKSLMENFIFCGVFKANALFLCPCKFKKNGALMWMLDTTKFRSIRPEEFCKKSVLRNFAQFTWKHPYQSFFFNKVVGLSLQLHWKSDSGTGVFLWILRDIQEYVICRTPQVDWFCKLLKLF